MDFNIRTLLKNVSVSVPASKLCFNAYIILDFIVIYIQSRNFVVISTGLNISL
jgi:hypothetical protein